MTTYGHLVDHRRRLGPVGSPRAIGCARVIPAARGWEWTRVVDQVHTAAVLLFAAGRRRHRRGDGRRRGVWIRRGAR